MIEEGCRSQRGRAWRWGVRGLLVLVLLVAGCYRFAGVDWDAGQHLHPDERFLTMVAMSLKPLDGVSYFDTAHSTLNPRNVGSRPHYVYGTLPVIVVRYVSGWLGRADYDNLHLVGRRLSAAADLLVVLLAYLMGARLVDRRAGLLAAALSAVTVLQVQLAHFFVVDTFMNLAGMAALYVAVVIARPGTGHLDEPGRWSGGLLLLLGAAFGAAAGVAVAVKLSAAPIVLVLPVALVVRLLALPPERRRRSVTAFAVCLGMAALLSVVGFRVAQPYAFDGPGVLGLVPSGDWLESLRIVAAQAGPGADAPPALQWARRPVWFAMQNMVTWGMGIPFGVLAWAGFAAAGVAMVRRRSPALLVPWLWVGGYCAWQSLANNPTMRYLLPVYAPLAVFAAWAVVRLYDAAAPGERPGRKWRVAAVAVATTVLVATAAWAHAFTRIYSRPVTRVEASRWMLQHLPGPINLHVDTAGGRLQQPLPMPEGFSIAGDRPYTLSEAARYAGVIRSVGLFRVLATADGDDEAPVTLELEVRTGAGTGHAQVVVDPERDPRTVEEVRVLELDQALAVERNELVTVTARMPVGHGEVRLEGAAVANESSWDDGLPLRVDGCDPLGGIFRGDLNLEIYWPDDEVKLERLLTVLDQADVLAVSSSRQWGSIPRLGERYPLSSAYYRDLIGCPEELTVEHCFNVAEPGTFTGRLDFDLVHVATSHPSLGGWSINDQWSEEAFTVYDHPKVLIFAKSPAYHPMVPAQLLGNVDLSRVMHVLPAQARAGPMDLMLPPRRLAEQRSGGTFGELFDRARLLNRSGVAAAVVWYLVLAVIGLACWPMLWLACGGLPDRGWGLVRVAGLLALAYPVWLLGTARVPFSRATILITLLCLAVLNGVLAWRHRIDLLSDWRRLRRHIVTMETLVLLLFVAGVLLRLGNPDLWHPARGGEKPMELSYLTAILKSSSFPPYDPWFAGGYLNYYYLGWLLVGVPAKLLGIMPSVAFNLILATLFALTGAGAYCVAWNLVAAHNRRHGAEHEDARARARPSPVLGGVMGLLFMCVLGNLGTVNMIGTGLVRLGAAAEGAGVVERGAAAVRGAVRFLGGERLPFGTGEWYWNPTRIIPDPEVGPITEFPYFSFLFADLHPHLLDLPLQLLVLGWALSVLLQRRRRSGLPELGWAQLVAMGLLGALATGALQAVNTWSFYPFLALAMVALGWAAWRASEKVRGAVRAGRSLVAMAVLAAAAHLLFLPYSWWYGSGYGEVEPWRGSHTPLGPYITHWGLLLFVVVTWLVVVAREPRSRASVVAATGVLVVGLVAAVACGVVVAWLALPVLVLALLVLLGSRGSPQQQMVLVMIAAGVGLTLLVELVVLRGDVGRMNTVFKLYLQAWTLLALGAGFAFAWLVPVVAAWPPVLRRCWSAVAGMLVVGAALYPLVATTARCHDRMAPQAPRSLDGMAYMDHATHWEEGRQLDLAEEARAIRWMQDNVQGSPVIVEYNTPEYRWGSRFTVYTGLPGVVGWNWHQRQQRVVTPSDWVWDRVEAVRAFYATTNLGEALDLLYKFDVSYIVVGQLERAYAPAAGLAKFERQEGVLWRAVYRDGSTTIYEVMRPPR